MTEYKPIMVHEDTKKRLDNIKIIPAESYEDVIKRGLDLLEKNKKKVIPFDKV